MHGWSKTFAVAALAVAATVTWACSDRTPNSPLMPSMSQSSTGNGAPSGSHYNLNIIGVPKDKTADMTGANGHVIFVQLNGGDAASSIQGQDFNTISKVNKIFLIPDSSNTGFQVLDANATDQNGAQFELPLDVSATWTVWARALGKPGGKADMTTCATVTVTDPITGAVTQEVDCSLNTLNLDRKKGNQKFQNVTNYLLYMQILVDPLVNADLAACLGVTSAQIVNVPLFNGCLQNYFWNYDNHGLKLLQLRFYPA
jgi:hypothetical protein